MVGGVSMADVDTAGELDGFEPSASSASEQPEEGWCRFFSIVASFLRECDRNTSTSDLSKMESICERLERSLCDIRRLHYLAMENAHGTDLERELSHLLHHLSTVTLPFWRRKHDSSVAVPSIHNPPPIQENGPHQRGRPPYLITEGQLRFLHELHFTWVDIGRLLGVSRMTLYRRRRDLGMVDHDDERYV